jgi:hypothetical protein
LTSFKPAGFSGWTLLHGVNIDIPAVRMRIPYDFLTNTQIYIKIMMYTIYISCGKTGTLVEQRWFFWFPSNRFIIEGDRKYS